MLLPLATLLPHKGPMLMVDEPLGMARDAARVSARLRSDNPFCTPEGPVHPAASIELLAQSASALLARDLKKNQERTFSGALVSITDFRCAPIPTEATATIELSITSSSRIFTEVAGSITADGQVRARGSVKLYNGEGQAEPPPAVPSHPVATGSIFPLSRWQRSHNTRSATYCFGTDFPPFSGHFPSRPMVPAAVLVAIGAEALCHDGRMDGLQVAQARFPMPVVPDVTVGVTHADGLTTITAQGAVAATMRLVIDT